jgi:hypothetical protein
MSPFEKKFLVLIVGATDQKMVRLIILAIFAVAPDKQLQTRVSFRLHSHVKHAEVKEVL